VEREATPLSLLVRRSLMRGTHRAQYAKQFWNVLAFDFDLARSG
jgi:hypothetical protein